MNEDKAQHQLTKLKNYYLLLWWVEVILFAGGAGLLLFATTSAFTNSWWLRIFPSLDASLFVFLTRAGYYDLFHFNTTRLTQVLNRKYPELQESADLMLSDPTTLTRLQQLQKIKVLHQFNALYHTIKLPQRVALACTSFIGVTLLYVALSGFSFSGNTITTSGNATYETEIQPVVKDSSASYIKSLSITITPPAYTGLSVFSSPTPNLAIPEGSIIKWTAVFSKKTSAPKIILSSKAVIAFKAIDETTFAAQQVLTEAGFYQVQWTDDKVRYSDYYKIEIQKDQAPKVSVDNLPQFTQLNYTDNLDINVKTSLSDDYGLKDSYIIATVSKGSGESVKFREEKLRFYQPSAITGKQVQALAKFNLSKLGLEPGDELYFYVEAFDTKTPLSNKSRTETFFVALRDTAEQVTSADEGLGVDVMPDYFRSQRQIIIDSEKLLKEKSSITKKEFNSRSNELAYDQKILRLKYGQFMGEEAESGIGEQAIPHDDDKVEDVVKQFGHAHDTQNEHNLVADKKDDHHHAESVKDPNQKEDPTAAYTHAHDNTEEATFVNISTRAKLKQALTEMWDAELHLRLYDPTKSLPYQYKALTLLKEISNDNRIYVHRTGFDPPPIKEEKRLTGDQSEVKPADYKQQQNKDDKYAAIRKALPIIENMIEHKSTTASASANQILIQAGQELSAIALQQPGMHLKSLSLIRSVTDHDIKPDKVQNALLEIRRSLWSALPQLPTTPGKQAAVNHSLNQKFVTNLEKLKHE